MSRAIKSLAPMILTAATLTLPLPALALSCMRPDPVRTIEWLEGRDVTHTVIYGDLNFEERFFSDYQQTPTGLKPEPQKKPAVLIGRDLTTGKPFDEIIMMERICSGSWCGEVHPGKNLLVIIEDPETDPHLREGACGGQVFYETDAALRQEIEILMRAKADR